MKFAMIIEIEDEALDGDNSIENAAYIVNQQNRANGVDYITVSPLSNEFSC